MRDHQAFRIDYDEIVRELITGAALKPPRILVGMDIIQQGDFLISNANGKTTFSFCLPSLKDQIDLLEISKKQI